MSVATVDPRKTFPRRFVPTDANMGDWAHIEPLFRELLDRKIDSSAALQRWLEDLSELQSAVAEEGSRRYVAMTQQTDDPQREQAYLHFVREIRPRLEPMVFALKKKYLATPHRHGLPQDRYFVFDRDTANDVELFREENIPLHVREAELQQQYQKITGGMTVHYRGEERTLQQMARFLEEPDRSVRQEAWERIVGRRLQEREAIEAIYEQLLSLRQQIARNAGFTNYLDYGFRAKGRWDYTPEDCERFHAAVAEHVVPVVQRLYEERRARLGLDALRPWDLDVDPLGRSPLRPFEHAGELVEKCERVFARVTPALGEQFRFMVERDLLDLDSRKGKAPGGYQATMHERRWPFIFMNAVGRDGDVRTIVHEGGHAFHALAAREEPLLKYRHAPLEFAEVASMGMEVLALPHLEVFYPDPDDARRARRDFFEGVVRLMPWIAIVDAFQHWIYTHPEHTRDERRAKWLELSRRFRPGIDWSGYEEAEAHAWHAQLHIFLHPLYYIEYGIAQLGALQLWLASRDDYAGAVRRYRAALALGGSRPLPDLFAAAGLRFAMDAGVVAPLAAALGEELRELS
ncbi:MAG: M3 family oligoendopeptidase [Armatimonadota bacterium]|nr:M3 family oligoendopeptidase [Armatimonadota bacterium]MDR5696193.1 M3 family oligoendopeptidase [Armatimonadota bacterium]